MSSSLYIENKQKRKKNLADSCQKKEESNKKVKKEPLPLVLFVQKN